MDLIKGGQGRSDESVGADAVSFAIVVASGVLLGLGYWLVASIVAWIG